VGVWQAEVVGFETMGEVKRRMGRRARDDSAWCRVSGICSDVED
jgi:hypothetical protein